MGRGRRRFTSAVVARCSRGDLRAAFLLRITAPIVVLRVTYRRLLLDLESFSVWAC